VSFPGVPARQFSLSDKQKEVLALLGGDETHCLCFGGARSGKTFLLCYAIANRGIMAPGSRHLIARRHNIDVRQSVMMDTWPTMMSLAFPGLKYELNKSDQFVTLPNDAEVWFGGLDDKERIEKILGKEYATTYVNEASQVSYDTVLTLRTRLAQNAYKADGTPLKQKAYYDLNPTGQGHWSYKEFVAGVRPDNDEPVRPGTRVYAVMNPTDNPNLSQAFLDELDALPERQRQRYKEGRYLSEVPGTLWPSELIEKARYLGNLPIMRRIVVAVDPSGSDGVGGDSQGIVVAGLGEDGICYVLADRTVRAAPGGPDGWARRVINAYNGDWSPTPEIHRGDRIVAERNFGGAMVKAVLIAEGMDAAYKELTASRGKVIRAEPIAALYEQGKVKHAGRFRELEDQMAMFTTAGLVGGSSPDRVDALVWAISELMLVPPVNAALILPRR
jgi:hypothetical protein